ncbi:hypothetical protein BJX65DRAFT_94058 [Aspergillus insuetus]
MRAVSAGSWQCCAAAQNSAVRGTFSSLPRLPRTEGCDRRRFGTLFARSLSTSGTKCSSALNKFSSSRFRIKSHRG